EISDDGAGLDCDKLLAKARERGLVGADEVLSEERIHELIFHPGFSTAQALSDVSGRGVGMDVVKRNIKELGGVIELHSKFGAGSTIRIRLPLTLAILDGQLVRVGDQTYIVPLVSIVESLQVESARVKSVVGAAELYRLRGDYIPIVRLYEVFNVEPQSTVLEQGLLVIIEGEGQRAGIFIDELLGQQQVVIKSLETNYRKVDGISGATILGDGTVAMIMDAGGLIALNRRAQQTAASSDRIKAA
ncbi:MAG: chemotaxis protein CheW, partial [Gammaproteobacteria bacterium]